MKRARVLTRTASAARWRSVIARRAAAFAVALLALSSALFAGKPYLFCVMMERSVEACCCAPDEPDSDSPEARAACCESHAGGDLAKARAAHDVALEVPSAALSGTAPCLKAPRTTRPLSHTLDTSPNLPIGNQIRAGPSKALDACVMLQVFRC